MKDDHELNVTRERIEYLLDRPITLVLLVLLCLSLWLPRLISRIRARSLSAMPE